jgi:hypothetical protein
MNKEPKMPKSLPKVGTLYKVRGDNLRVLEDTIRVWREVAADEYVEHHFTEEDPTTILLTEIVEIPSKNITLTATDEDDLVDKIDADYVKTYNTGIKHSFIFLIGNKKIATTPFHLPMFDIIFEKQSGKRQKKI